MTMANRRAASEQIGLSDLTGRANGTCVFKSFGRRRAQIQHLHALAPRKHVLLTEIRVSISQALPQRPPSSLQEIL